MSSNSGVPSDNQPAKKTQRQYQLGVPSGDLSSPRTRVKSNGGIEEVRQGKKVPVLMLVSLIISSGPK